MMDGAEAPLVSVVMPVCNGERYLREAIDSILGQTYRDLELVVVDDGSQDGSRGIVAACAGRDARVRPINAAHRGVVPTLNAGCAAARGRYIARLDQDDIALPERLEQQVALLERHPEVALVGASFQCINAAGERGPIVATPPPDDARLREALTRTNCFCDSTMMMRTDALAALGGYRPLYTDAEDYDLWTRFADTHELASIQTVLVLYRIHPRQMSLTRVEQQALVTLAIRLASEIRRRTGVDPLADCAAIDRCAVRGLGVTDDQIDTHLISTYLKYLSTMPTLGLGTAALEALREVVAHRSLLDHLDSGRDA